MKFNRLIALCSLLLVSAAGTAWADSSLRDVGSIPLRLAGDENAAATRVYIVQLRQPSAAEYHASLLKKNTGPAAVDKTRSRLDKTSPVLQSYARQLAEEQDRVLGKAGPDARKIYSYRFGLNGFAARMSTAQAQKLQNLPEVLNVWEDEVRPMATRYSPTLHSGKSFVS